MATKYLTKKAYGQKLLDPRWQKKRLEILEQNDFTCQYCGEKEKTLHVHHLSYKINGDPWDASEGSLLCLCEDCHKVEHLSGLTEIEKQMLYIIQETAIMLGGKDKMYNLTVNQINSILLKLTDNV